MSEKRQPGKTDKKPNRSALINRRSVLKSLAAGGAVAVSAPAAAAKKKGLSEEEVESILQEPEVEQISKITGKLDASQGDQNQFEISGQQVTVTELESEYGPLTYSEIESGVAEAKLVIEDLEEQPTLRQVLTDKYESVPVESGLKVVLVSDGSSAQLIREATSEEVKELQTAIARSEPGAEVKQALYDSDVQSYRVFVEAPEDENGVDSEDSQDISQYIVSAEGEKNNLSANSVKPAGESVDRGVTAQGCPFTLGCGLCASALVARGICIASCASGAGPVCLACIINTSIAYPLSCVNCLDNCA